MLTDIDLFTAAEGLELANLVRDRRPPIRIILTSGNWSFTESELTFAERFIPKSIRPCLG